VTAAVLGDDDVLNEVPADDSATAMTPARAFATADQARQIVAAHFRHRRPLLEALSPALIE
jgi:hypothetical protein